MLRPNARIVERESRFELSHQAGEKRIGLQKLDLIADKVI
jgi:hypothetical protein